MDESNVNMSSLIKELQFYKQNKADLLVKYEGKYVVIVGENVVGSYDSYQEAVTASVEKYEPGTFFIQRVTDKDEIAILSRVVP